MDTPTRAERLEAEVRRLMAQHSRVIPRGFDTRQERATLHRRIDETLDEWLLNAPIPEQEPAS